MFELTYFRPRSLPQAVPRLSRKAWQGGVYFSFPLFLMISSPPDVSTRDVRCSETLDGALSQLYHNGRVLTIGGRSYPDFRSAMIAVLDRSPSARKAIAARISRELGGVYRVSTEVDRKLWEWMRPANGRGSNGHAH